MLGFIASNSAQSVGPTRQVWQIPFSKVSSPLIRLNPWDIMKNLVTCPGLGFIASNSAQSVGPHAKCGRSRSRRVSSPLIRLNPWDQRNLAFHTRGVVSSPLIRLNPWDQLRPQEG